LISEAACQYNTRYCSLWKLGFQIVFSTHQARVYLQINWSSWSMFHLYVTTNKHHDESQADDQIYSSVILMGFYWLYYNVTYNYITSFFFQHIIIFFQHCGIEFFPV
jgi:hypothetical protein